MKKLALFQIGGSTFGLDFAQVLDLHEPKNFRELAPARPPFVGVATQEGALLPIADLSQLLLGHNRPPVNPMWLLVSLSGGQGIGVLIDGPMEEKNIEPDEGIASSKELISASQTHFAGFVGRHTPGGTPPIPILSLDGLFSESDRQWIEETQILGMEVSPEMIEKTLGQEWSRMHQFFPRVVNHLCSLALNEPKNLTDSIQSCKADLAELLPKTLDESVPFVVRYLWNRGLGPHSENYEEVVNSYRNCVLMSDLPCPWTIDELKKSISEIMGGAPS